MYERTATSWQGNDTQLSAGIFDFQTVKTTEKRGIKGYSARKKINIRKGYIFHERKY